MDGGPVDQICYVNFDRQNYFFCGVFFMHSTPEVIKELILGQGGRCGVG